MTIDPDFLAPERLWDMMAVYVVVFIVTSLFEIFFSAIVGQFTFTFMMLGVFAYAVFIMTFLVNLRASWGLFVLLFGDIYTLLTVTFIFFFNMSSFFSCSISACAGAFFYPFILFYVANAMFVYFCYIHIKVVWDFLHITYDQ